MNSRSDGHDRSALDGRLQEGLLAEVDVEVAGSRGTTSTSNSTRSLLAALARYSVTSARRSSWANEPHHAASPVRTPHRITTPTLILHSEADWRCPIEQGEQLFVALRHAGVPSELLRFPDESHELSRSGSPKHRVERFEAILDWHARYLDVEVAD